MPTENAVRSTAKVAIVTGGSRGLGRNTVINLAKRGVPTPPAGSPRSTGTWPPHQPSSAWDSACSSCTRFVVGLFASRDAGLADIDKAMKAEGQLAVARFPSMTFRSVAITKQADGQYVVMGRLTIRGVTQEVRFPARVTLEGAQLRGRAQLQLKQSGFGYQPYSALLGAIKNKDEVILHIDLVAKP